MPTTRIPEDLVLHMDQYELTMLEDGLVSGITEHPAIFEVFARDLPNGWRYGVLGGVGRLLEMLEEFRFGEEICAWLRAEGIVSQAAADYLADYRFSGEIRGYREGELYTANSPVLQIWGRFADTVLETLVLSTLNADSGVATKADRIRRVAGPSMPLIEMGGRRVHGDYALDAARAAYVGGFDSTSNLAARYRYGIPTAGTAAHAFTMAHPTERQAFLAQVASRGAATTLLVDTYGVEGGVANALAAAGPGLGAVRIDSGDLDDVTRQVRRQLDRAGASETGIIVTGDLDEYRLRALVAAGAPVAAAGVGTRLVTGWDPPGFVFKLVAIDDGVGTWRAVAKRSSAKATVGGPKQATRLREGDQLVEVINPATAPLGPGRPLQVSLYEGGRPLVATDARSARRTREAALAELGPLELDGPRAIEPRYVGLDVATLAAEVIRSEAFAPVARVA